MNNLKSVDHLIEALAKLPGIGKRSAERMAYAMLNMSKDDLDDFILAIKGIEDNIHFCSICGALSEDDKCEICKDESRDKDTILVVSYPKDVISIENSHGYKGLYHVLNGEISISKGKNVEDLNISSLLKRVEKGDIKEIILATNPTLDGETTALYIAKLLEKYNIKITRLAYGLQMGSNLDYTDELTLVKALEGRRNI